jgi:hypothetical protein
LLDGDVTTLRIADGQDDGVVADGQVVFKGEGGDGIGAAQDFGPRTVDDGPAPGGDVPGGGVNGGDGLSLDRRR